ncbi:MAG: LptE family protein [Acidimicrobiia bacterium]|nr:LptE family protein [Acidimicrobiia bacterium]
MKKIKSYSLFHLLLIASVVFAGCKTYSFTGASIPPDAKTISVEYIPNRAPQVQASLSQKLTELLKEKFVSQTNLTLVADNGDMRFSGSIIDYRTQPVAIQSTDLAALNRLTITVNIIFENTKDETKSFEKKFSRYLEYSSEVDLISVEDDLIDQINEQLSDDIFNAAFIDW